MKTIEETTLLSIRVGDRLRIKEDNRTGQLVEIQLTPNGVENPVVVALLTIQFKNGGRFQATSDKFIPVEKELYLEKMYN